jgi:hypothetical protein
MIDFDNSDGAGACGGASAPGPYLDVSPDDSPAGIDQMYLLDTGDYSPALVSDLITVADACNDYDGDGTPDGAHPGSTNDYPLWTYTSNGFYNAEIYVLDREKNEAFLNLPVSVGALSEVWGTLYDGWNLVTPKLQNYQWCAPTDPGCTLNNNGQGFYPTAANMWNLYPEVQVVAKFNNEFGSPTYGQWDWVQVTGSNPDEDYFMDHAHDFDGDLAPDPISTYPTINGDDITLGDGRIPTAGEVYAIYIDLSLAGANLQGGGPDPGISVDTFIDGDMDGTQASGAVDTPHQTTVDSSPDPEVDGYDFCVDGNVDCNHWGFNDLNTNGDLDFGVDAVFWDFDNDNDWTDTDVNNIFLVTPNSPALDWCDPNADPFDDCYLLNDVGVFVPTNRVMFLDTNGNTDWDGATGDASEDIYVRSTALEEFTTWQQLGDRVDIYAEGDALATTYGGQGHPGLTRDDGSGVPGAGWNAWAPVVDLNTFSGTPVDMSTILSSLCVPYDDGGVTGDSSGYDTTPALHVGAGTSSDGIVDSYVCRPASDNSMGAGEYYGIVKWDAQNQEWFSGYAANSDIFSIAYTEIQSAGTTADHTLDLANWDMSTLLYVGENFPMDEFELIYDMDANGYTERNTGGVNNAPIVGDQHGHSNRAELVLDRAGSDARFIDSDGDGILSLDFGIDGFEDVPSSTAATANDIAYDHNFATDLDIEIDIVWYDADDDAPTSFTVDVIGPSGSVMVGAPVSFFDCASFPGQCIYTYGDRVSPFGNPDWLEGSDYIDGESYAMWEDGASNPLTLTEPGQYQIDIAGNDGNGGTFSQSLIFYVKDTVAGGTPLPKFFSLTGNGGGAIYYCDDPLWSACTGLTPNFETAGSDVVTAPGYWTTDTFIDTVFLWQDMDAYIGMEVGIYVVVNGVPEIPGPGTTFWLIDKADGNGLLSFELQGGYATGGLTVEVTIWVDEDGDGTYDTGETIIDFDEGISVTGS